jgi:hypothetical protein
MFQDPSLDPRTEKKYISGKTSEIQMKYVVLSVFVFKFW